MLLADFRKLIAQLVSCELIPVLYGSSVINSAVDVWGLQCLWYEIRDIMPPEGLARAMELQVHLSYFLFVDRRSLARTCKSFVDEIN